MSVFQISVAAMPDYWTVDVKETPLTYQYRAFEESLNTLALKYVVNTTLDPDCVPCTIMPTEILRRALKFSVPISSIIDKYHIDTLIGWEVYSKCLLDPYLAMVSNRRATLKKQALVKLQMRSFHVGSSAEDLATFDKILKKIEYTTNARIEWKKIVVDGTISCDEPKANLETAKMGGVEVPPQVTPLIIEGKYPCDMTVANARSWKNRIAISLKALEVYVDMGSDAKYTASSIFLAISSLNIGGISIIILPKVADTQNGVNDLYTYYRV